MSYNTPEISQQDGAPVELLTFTYGPVTYLYTTAEDDYAVGSDTYTASAITISAVEASNEAARNNLEIEVPRDNPIALLFRVSPPTQVIAVTYGRVHRTDDTDEVLTPFVGRVLNADWDGPRAKLVCEPISRSQSRNGNYRKYARTCPYALYGSACGVSLASFQSSTTVSSVSGLVLNVAAVNPAYSYRGGFVSWTDDDGVEQFRFITAQTTTALTLNIPFQGIAGTDTVVIAPGCDHSIATCSGDFGNGLNYGGFPKLPTKNPFDGTPIY